MKQFLKILLVAAYAQLVYNNMSSLNTEIKPGDRVSVSVFKGDFYRGKYTGTVVRWTDSGKLSVKADKGGAIKPHNPDHVKKLLQ